MTDTNNTDGAALLPVTQADRDAAADIIEAIADKLRDRDAWLLTVEAWRRGARGHIDRAHVAQAFARHRISHSLPATQEDAERSVAGSDDTSQADRDHAMKWINHNMMLATGLMKSSSEAGNGAENFRAHDAYRALKVAKAALSTPQRQEYDGEAE